MGGDRSAGWLLEPAAPDGRSRPARRRCASFPAISTGCRSCNNDRCVGEIDDETSDELRRLDRTPDSRLPTYTWLARLSLLAIVGDPGARRRAGHRFRLAGRDLRVQSAAGQRRCIARSGSALGCRDRAHGSAIRAYAGLLELLSNRTQPRRCCKRSTRPSN